MKFQLAFNQVGTYQGGPRRLRIAKINEIGPWILCQEISFTAANGGALALAVSHPGFPLG
jgi:hypothetical protein